MLHDSGVQTQRRDQPNRQRTDKETSKTLTCYTGARAHRHIKSQRRVSFYLPAQISRRANYEGSITPITLEPSILWGTAQTLGSKQSPRAGEFLHQRASVRTQTRLAFGSDCMKSNVGVCVCERESERRQGHGVCAAVRGEQRISILNAQMETVWRQWRGWNNHRLAKHLKHLGQRKLPLCFFKHRALTWCSSHAPLYWCPCPIHWGVPAKSSRSLTGAASQRIWSCGCKEGGE